jgi:hypothetical protein
VKLPNLENAHVPQAKITEYLLSSTHSTGRGKAKFFIQFGFSAEQWEVLAEALLNHAKEHEVTKLEPTPFGTRYVIEGTLETPVKRTPLVRVVWFIDTDGNTPRFVTAYPREESEGTHDPGT